MSMSGDVVRFNVGGAPIEIARETLDAYPQSLIRGLALACPAGAEVKLRRERRATVARAATGFHRP